MRLRGDDILNILGFMNIFMGKKKRAILESAARSIAAYHLIRSFRRQVRDAYNSRTPMMLDLVAIDELESFFQSLDSVATAVEAAKRN